MSAKKKRRRKFKIKVAKAIMPAVLPVLGAIGGSGTAGSMVAGGALAGAGGGLMAGLGKFLGGPGGSSLAGGLLGPLAGMAGGGGGGKTEEEIEAEKRARLLAIQQEQVMSALRLAQFFQSQTPGLHQRGR